MVHDVREGRGDIDMKGWRGSALRIVGAGGSGNTRKLSNTESRRDRRSE